MGEWVDDPTINGYVSLLSKTFSEDGICASSSFLLVTTRTKKKKEDGRELIEAQCEGIRKTIRLEEKKKWIIPINEENVHWKLAVVMLREHLIVFYDSISNGPPSIHMECADTIRLLLKTYGRLYGIGRFENRPWISTCLNSFSSLQPDADSCGIYCLVAAEINANNPDHLIREIRLGDIKAHRNRISQALLQDHLSESECVADFSSIKPRPATDALVSDPHFYSETQLTLKGSSIIRKRLGALKSTKEKGIGSCYYPRYCVMWTASDDHMVALYQMADRCAEKITLKRANVCIRISGYSGESLLLERMILANLMTRSLRVYLYVLCDHAISDLGRAPLEDEDPSSLIFRSQDYCEVARMSEEIHTIRQTIGEVLDGTTVSRKLPKGPCDLYITRSMDPSDGMDVEMRRGPIREASGYAVYSHGFESVQIATRAGDGSAHDGDECMMDVCSVSRCLYPCYSEERVERLSFFH